MDTDAKVTAGLQQVSDKLAKSAAQNKILVDGLDTQAQETAQHAKEERKAFENAFGYKFPEHDRRSEEDPLGPPSSFVEEDGDADSKLHKSFMDIDETRDEMHKMDKEVKHELAAFRHGAQKASAMLHDVQKKRMQRANAYRQGKLALPYTHSAPSSFLQASPTIDDSPLTNVEASLAQMQRGMRAQMASFKSEAQKTALAEKLAMKKMATVPRTSLLEEPDASSDDTTSTDADSESSDKSDDDSATETAAATTSDTAADKSSDDSSTGTTGEKTSDTDSASSDTGSDDSSTDAAAETTSDADASSDSDSISSDKSSDESTTKTAAATSDSDATETDASDDADKASDGAAEKGDDDADSSGVGKESDTAKAEDATEAGMEKARRLDERIKERTAKLLQEAQSSSSPYVDSDARGSFSSILEKKARAHDRQLAEPTAAPIDATKDLDAFEDAAKDVSKEEKKMQADSARFLANMDAVTSDAGPSSFVQGGARRGQTSSHATAADTLAAWKAQIEQRAAEQRHRASHVAKLLAAPLSSKLSQSFLQETELADLADDGLGDGLESKIDELDEKSRDGMDQLDSAVHKTYGELGENDADAVSEGLNAMSPLSTPDRFAAATDPLSTTDPLSASNFPTAGLDSGLGDSSDLPSSSLSAGDGLGSGDFSSPPDAGGIGDLGGGSLGGSDIGGSDFGSSDLGSSDLGSSDLGSSGLGSSGLEGSDLGGSSSVLASSSDLGSSSSDLGSSDLGSSSSDLGSSDLGSSDLGSSDLGGSDLGSSDLGSSDLGSTSPDFGSSGLGSSSADLGSSSSDFGSSDLGSTDTSSSSSDFGSSDLGSTDAGSSSSDLGDDLGAESLLETTSKATVGRARRTSAEPDHDQLRKHA